MKNNEPVREFNPDAGAPIPVTEAADWTANYRKEPTTEAEAAGRKRINAFYFGNKLLDEIQRQDGCVGLRFYMGLQKTEDGSKRRDESQLIVVGVDKDGHDIVARQGPQYATEGDDGIVGDASGKCPSMCDPTSPLS